MAVEYIKYKNKKYPVKLGYYALMMLQKEHGVSMEGIEGNIALYEPLLFYSLEQGAKATKQELTLTRDDMIDVLDDCFFQFIELIPKFFPVEELGKRQVAIGKPKKK